MSYWSGKYEDTKESKEPLEKDIERAMDGKYYGETSSGYTIREQYNSDGSGRIDVYGPSDSSKGHSHDRLDSDSNGNVSTYHRD